MNTNITKINQEIENGLILPSNIIFNKDFQNMYLNIESISLRRYYINNLIKNNYSIYEILNEKLIYKYDDLFFNNFENFINTYKNIIKIPNNEKIVKEICSNILYQILTDRYFGDYKDNIIINISNMLNFNEKNNNCIIDEKNVNIYKDILYFNDYDFEKEVKIYKSIPYNISSMLYDDFRNCQNYAYNLINESIIDINSLNHKKINNTDIYYLNGEIFILPVHCSNIKRDNINSKWSDTSNTDTLSLSLIGNECLGLFNNPKEYITIGFNKLNINNIMHIYHSDSHTKGMSSTSNINELYTPHELLLNTYKYNEILIKQNIKNNAYLIPSYIVCFDEITDNDIKCSINFNNIPIILINSKCYNQKNNNDNNSEKKYIKTIYDLYIRDTK